MEPLTFFTTPRPHEGRDGRNERDFRNAVRTWMRLEPTPEVIVFGGDRRIAEEEGARHVGFHPCNERGLPYVDAMFRIAEQVSSNDIMVYTSDHLMFTKDVTTSLVRVLRSFYHGFVIIGQRTNTAMDRLIDFDDEKWEDRLRAQAGRAGALQGPSAKDYIIFRRPLELDIPPFVAGRPGWDSWIVRAALNAGIHVLDATRSIMAIHAYHDLIVLDEEREQGQDTVYNYSLCAAEELRGAMTDDATWVMTDKWIREKKEGK